jgi:tRNA C32,U32 (ribose-2'-O)-methylase TrmJ
VRAGDRRQPLAPARRARPDGRRGGGGPRPPGSRCSPPAAAPRPTTSTTSSTRGAAAPTAWLLGNEAAGLSEQALALADRTVRIPIRGRAESLNLSTAAAVCLYASARRIGRDRD